MSSISSAADFMMLEITLIAYDLNRWQYCGYTYTYCENPGNKLHNVYNQATNVIYFYVYVSVNWLQKNGEAGIVELSEKLVKAANKGEQYAVRCLSELDSDKVLRS